MAAQIRKALFYCTFMMFLEQINYVYGKEQLSKGILAHLYIKNTPCMTPTHREQFGYSDKKMSALKANILT